MRAKGFVSLAAVAALATLGLATMGLATFGAVNLASAQDKPTGDAANGKRVFLADGCFMCHGRVGEGGAFNYPAPAIAQVALPEESFVAFLRDAPNDMPSFSTAVLSDKEATDIYAYLQSLSGRKPVKDFPLLNQ
jgi:mono/diheme cytochrome c family protein